MGDLAADTKVTGSVGRYSARLSRDWELGGPSGGYIASVALRAAGEHSRFGRPVSIVGHFLGVASFSDVIIETKTLQLTARAESIRVTLKQHKNEIFEALVWTCAPMEGLEHELALSPAAYEPDSVPSTAQRIAEEGLEPIYPFWKNFDERAQTWMTRDEWVDSHAGVSRVRTVVPLRPAVDVRRPLGRRVPFAHPHRDPRLAGRDHAAHRQRVRRTEHRHLVHVPPGAHPGSVALRPDDLGERERRCRRMRGQGLVARRCAARDGHEPTSVPTGSHVVESAPWKTASRRGCTSR